MTFNSVPAENCKNSLDLDDDRIRLVHVTTVPFTLIFFKGQIGYLKSRGFNVSAVSSSGPMLDDIGHCENIDVYPVEMERGFSPFKDIFSLWRLWRLFRQLQPNVVHSHAPKAALLGTLAARMAGVDIVVLSIFGIRQMNMTGFSRRLLDFTTRLSCKLADRVWCDSFSVRNFVARTKLCRPEKLVVLGNGSVMGVDAHSKFSPSKVGVKIRNEVRIGHGIPVDALTLGFVGRIVADKGMHELAEAWLNLRERFSTLHLLLVGPFESEDPVSPEVEALFRNDERIHLAGQRKDVAREFAAMDVFVMPSYREGFGMTNIEAAAMAIPVVSTMILGCIESVKDGVTGTLVAAGHAGELERAIQRYLDDPILREKHGNAGRERVMSDFRPETIWESLREMYIELADKKGLELPVAIKTLD